MGTAPRVLVVTGGSRGIGRAISIGAAARGYAVCLSFLGNETAARETVEEIEAEGGTAIAVKADSGQPDDVERLFIDAQRVGILAGLVNNAGTIGPLAPVSDMSVERIERVFRTNVVGAFLCARQGIRYMSTRMGGAGGTIINLSSTAARIGGAGGTIDYAATKGAIETFTRGLAIEVALDGIRVNAVAPGMIETEIHADTGQPDRLARIVESIPMRRIGTAEEVAASVLWLLSPEASYVTGSVLTVSGGR